MSEARHAVAGEVPGQSPLRSLERRAGGAAALQSSTPRRHALSIPAPELAQDWFASRFNAARSGDNVAFADVYRDTQPRLYRYAITLVGREAEDVTAEAWLQIARDLRGFTGDAQAFRAWAATVVRNRAMDHLRSAGRRPVVLTDSADLERPSNADTESGAAEVDVDRGRAGTDRDPSA